MTGSVTAATDAPAPVSAAPASSRVAPEPPVLDATVLVAAVVVGAADAAAWAGWVLEVWGPAVAVGLHLASAGAVGVFARLIVGRRGTALGLGFLAVAVLGLGPLGAVGLIFAGGLYAWFRRHAQPFDEWFESLFPDLQLSPEQLLADRIRSGREEGAAQAGVAPFVDVLRLGTREQKEAVIAMLARHFTPGFAPALKLALADETPVIRVQAATAAATIENGLLQTAMRLSAAMAAAPGDPAAVLALARHTEMHADLGLMDAQQEQEARRRAVELFRAVLDRDPGNEEARLGVGRGLMRLGRTDDALPWIEECLALGLHRLDLVDWYADCLFRTGDLERLRREVARYADVLDRAGPADRDVVERLAFWVDAADVDAERAA